MGIYISETLKQKFPILSKDTFNLKSCLKSHKILVSLEGIYFMELWKVSKAYSKIFFLQLFMIP